MFQILTPVFHSKLLWLAAVIVGCIYLYLKFVVYTYWKRRGVPYDPPLVPFGNALPAILGKISMGNLLKKNYEKFKKNPFHGVYMFHQPLIMINDPELIRLVLIKEFHRFRDRGLYYNEEVDPLSAHLFLLPGEKWKQLRAKLSPTFTSGKLKQMFPLLQEIGDGLVKVCDSAIQENDIVEFKDLIGRYTTDSIATIAFGFDCKSLDNPDNDFKRYGALVFDQNPVKNAFATFAPGVLDFFRIPLTDTRVIKFFTKTFQDMVNYRRENKIVRKDFLDLLIQLVDKGALEDDENAKNADSTKLTDRQAQAQAFVFFIAGFETTSSTVTYCLYELALNPDVQQKLQDEIDEQMQKPGGVTYDRIMNEFEYLHMVFSETLRKHPSVPVLNRVANEDFDIPNSNLRIEKGTGVLLSVSGLQSDPDIFPNPHKFDPMRFSKENVAARSPYVYLPFGDGPRICIGSRFGILQSKIALIGLLANFQFSVCEKTQVPLLYSKRSFTQGPAGGVYLRMEKRMNKKIRVSKF